MRIAYHADVSKVLKDYKQFPKIVSRAIIHTKPVVLERYKKEIPVLSGEARRYSRVDSIGGKLGEYKVFTTASNKGFSYPTAVHGGTGRFRGSQKDYPSFGRVKSGDRSGRGLGGIRPNMFALRTKLGLEDRLIRMVTAEISKEINKR